MSPGIVGGIASAIAAVIGRITVQSRPDRLRRRIQSTIDVLERVKEHPELSGAKRDLAKLIDEQAAHLGAAEKTALERKYDPSQPVIGTLFAIALGYGAYRTWELGEWYGRGGGVILGIIAAMSLYVGIAGFFTPPAGKTSK